MQTSTPLKDKQVVLFVGDDYEDMELQYPKYRLIEAGARVTVAGLESGTRHLGKHGYPQASQAAVKDLNPLDFDAVVIPGGWMPDKLRRADEVKKLVSAMDAAGRCVASICHGGWVCASAQVVSGRNYTGSPGIQDDLVHAGALWQDASVVVDGHHVSSRKPDDLPDFCRGIIHVMTAGNDADTPEKEADTAGTDGRVGGTGQTDSGQHFG